MIARKMTYQNRFSQAHRVGPFSTAVFSQRHLTRVSQNPARNIKEDFFFRPKTPVERLIQNIFYRFILKPLGRLLMTPKICGLENLPQAGPAVLVANHNSHVDTFLILSLFSPDQLHKVHPLGASDYFLRSPWRWIRGILRRETNMLPVERPGQGSDARAAIRNLRRIGSLLDQQELLLVYPEGSRGKPGKLDPFKFGWMRVLDSNPSVPVIPIYLHGTGKVLPKGSFWPKFSQVDVIIGNAMILGEADRQGFTERLENFFRSNQSVKEANSCA